MRTLVLLLTLPSVAYAAPPPSTLCDISEIPVYSCAAGKKTVSICVSSDLTERSGYLQYRFGSSPQSVELEYPKAKEHPSKHFRLAIEEFAKANSSMLAFSIGDIEYAVFVEHAAFDWNGQGVVIKKKEKPIARLFCAQRPVPDDLYKLKDIGIPMIPYGRGWRD